MSEPIIEQINFIIADLKGRFTPNRDLMTRISGHMHANVMNNFSNQGAEVQAGGWHKLAASTLKAKGKKNQSLDILQAKGNLLRSIQASADNDSSTVFTNLRYAAIHNYGGVINIHARTRTLFHRTDKKGNFLRQEGYGNLAVFGLKKHKQVSAYTFGQGAYSITMHKRQYMVITSAYKTIITGEIEDYVTRGMN